MKKLLNIFTISFILILLAVMNITPNQYDDKGDISLDYLSKTATAACEYYHTYYNRTITCPFGFSTCSYQIWNGDEYQGTFDCSMVKEEFIVTYH